MITIWPQYLNRNLTTGEGRKISQEDSVKDPTINEIERALKRLNLTFEIEKDKAYLYSIIKNNAEKAQYFANKTLRKVQKKVGFPERPR